MTGLDQFSKIVMTPEREFSSWIGGSIFGTSSVFEELKIKRSTWQEEGPRAIYSSGIF
jgi:actin-related protein